MKRDEFHTRNTHRHDKIFIFFLVFVGVLSLSYGVLYAVDFLPESNRYDVPLNIQGVQGIEKVQGNEDVPVTLGAYQASTTPENTGEVEASHIKGIDGQNPEGMTSSSDLYPVRVIFDELDSRVVPVLNPKSRDVAVLDEALLKGVVRHPDSADFERTGTIFLFGHSSYLPHVVNKNFQAFNGIEKMRWGDIVRLESESREYIYRVDRVYKVSAHDAEVKIETGKAKLTLVTCDSFGAKSDRFILEATLINSEPK
jgi:LPXTG-site transpeptidase (sortase) family protein